MTCLEIGEKEKIMAYNYADKADVIYIIGKIKTYLTQYLDAKQDAENGKGLSTNDFTDALKTKLENLTQVVVDAALSSVSENPVQNKVIKGALDNKADSANAVLTGTPTAPTATAGDSSTQIATTAFVSSAIAAAISEIVGIDIQVVQTLPATGQTGVIYLVANGSSTSQNIYDEYIWISFSSTFEKIGTTAVDLSNYVQRSDMVSITTAEIDAMFANW